MPRVRDPSGQARQAGKASGPALKRCLDATVLTADRIDYWIRRHVIEYPPGAAGGVAPELRSADALLSAPAFASARHPVRPSRLERPVRSKPALACDRRAWLAALGARSSANKPAPREAGREGADRVCRWA